MDFPRCSDGDVLIVISGARQYRLHANILRNYSSFFKEHLTDELGPPLTNKATKKGTTIRWRFDYVARRIENDDGSYDLDHSHFELQSVQMDGEGKPVTPRPIPLDLENGIMPEPVFEAFHNVFSAIYGHPVNLAFQPDSDFSDILTKTGHILNVANYLDMIAVISRAVESDFQASGQALHTTIANNPSAWLNIAMQLKSRFLFREAVIHAVGQYNTDAMRAHYSTDADHSVSRSILNLITKKHEMLNDGLKKAQLKMLSYYPRNLSRDLTVGLADRDRIGRNSYSNDIFGWMSLMIFRHFVGQNLAVDETHNDKDLGYQFFALIAAGGSEYLHGPDLDGFYSMFPLTAKGKTVVETHLANIKEHCRAFAKGFMTNNTQLDVKSNPSGFFTCAKVDWEDYSLLEETAQE